MTLDTVDLAGASPDELSAETERCGQLAQTDAVAASARLHTITEEAGRRGLHDLVAPAAYLRARIEVARGNLRESLALIDAARIAWMKVGATVSALRTDLGRMHVLDDLGEHHEAIAVGQGVIHALDELGADQMDDEAMWLRAAALENLGVGRGYLGDHVEALDAYAEAEAVYRAMGLEEDIPRPLANRGVELLELGRLTEAIGALREAAVLFEQHNDMLSIARCLVYEARAQILAGNYLDSAAALDAADNCLAGHEGGIDDGRMQLVRADTLASLNLADEALELYESLIERFTSGGLRHDRAWALYGSAKVLHTVGSSVDATQRFESAEIAFREVGNSPMEAMSLLGRSGGSRGDEAVAMAMAAHAALAESARPSGIVSACVRLSELHESHAAAQPYLAEARRILDAHDLPQLRWQLEREEARWARSTGDVAGAQAKLRSAASIIDSLRDTVVAEELRLPFLGSRRGVHEDLLDLMLHQGQIEAAFEASVRFRARTLVERLAGRVAPAAARRTTGELDSIYGRLLEANSDFASGLAQRARELERAVAPDLRPSHQAATAVDVSPELFADRPTVMFELIGDEIAAFVLDGQGIRAIRHVSSVSDVAALLARLDAQWRRFDDRSLAVRQRSLLHEAAVDILQRLFLALFGRIPWLLDYESLVVVPVGLLANVPFGALHDGMCHLIERMPVTLAATPYGVANPPTSRDVRKLVMGVEDEHAPWIRTEAEAVAGMSRGTTLLLNDDATTDALEKHAGSHDVIHLACHGLNRPDNPSFSALRLGDRWLTAAEVARLSLDGQLVILSACSSGRQRGGNAPDEPNGLPRAFLAAGAGAVVVNLWQVDDEASARLMTSFHEHLESSLPTEALRAAQTEILRRQPHPYLWAPSVIYGLHPVREEIQ